MRFEIDAIPVVVVDGDELSRHVMVRRLLRWGYDPIAFTRGADALAHLHRYPARALVCDLFTAPGGAKAPGLEFMHDVRTVQSDLPVFVVTASPTPEGWAQVAHAGARDLLPKQTGSAEALRRALQLALADDLDDRDDLRLAHSLRTPLTALKSAIDILCSGQAGDLPESQLRFAAIAQRNTDKMIALVEELLETAARP